MKKANALGVFLVIPLLIVLFLVVYLVATKSDAGKRDIEGITGIELSNEKIISNGLYAYNQGPTNFQEYETAIQKFTEALASLPLEKNYDLQYLISDSYYKMGNYYAAKKEFAKLQDSKVPIALKTRSALLLKEADALEEGTQQQADVLCCDLGTINSGRLTSATGHECSWTTKGGCSTGNSCEPMSKCGAIPRVQKEE